MADIDQFSLLPIAKRVSQATYLDVNPLPNPGSTELLMDAAAILASIRNLIKCSEGSRGRIFQEDYFCGLYNLIHEPFDAITSTKIGIALYQALSRWDPRINWAPADVRVTPNPITASYDITLSLNVPNGASVVHTFSLSSR